MAAPRGTRPPKGCLSIQECRPAKSGDRLRWFCQREDVVEVKRVRYLNARGYAW